MELILEDVRCLRMSNKVYPQIEAPTDKRIVFPPLWCWAAIFSLTKSPKPISYRKSANGNADECTAPNANADNNLAQFVTRGC